MTIIFDIGLYNCRFIIWTPIAKAVQVPHNNYYKLNSFEVSQIFSNTKLEMDEKLKIINHFYFKPYIVRLLSRVVYTVGLYF